MLNLIYMQSHLITHCFHLGIGNILLVYDTESRKLCLRRKIFDKASIHGIQFNDKQMLVAVHGERYVAIYKLTSQMGFL